MSEEVPGRAPVGVLDVFRQTGATTGGSIRDVLNAVRQAGGEPAWVTVLADRTAGATDFGVPFFACMALEVESYEPSQCPLCREAVPLTRT